MSSGDMERAANVIMWRRSIKKNKMRYTALVSDGDTNTYKAICNAKPYGDDIEIIKIECVNHVGKRMGRALTDLVKLKVFYVEDELDEPKEIANEVRNSSKGKIKNTEKTKKAKKVIATKAKKKTPDKKTVTVKHMGGRHGINAKFIRCMQGYYTNIIKKNDTVEGMQHDFHAMIDHITSTDKNPMHRKCPAHRPDDNPTFKSYCFMKRYEWKKRMAIQKWQRMECEKMADEELQLSETSENARRYYGKSMPKTPRSIFKFDLKRPLHSSMNLRLRFARNSIEFREFMKVMARVCDPELLKRCLENKTQNLNESFHQRIWNMIPKHKHFEVDQLEFSICQNILTHSLGYEEGSLLKDFGINITKPIKALWKTQEKSRVKVKSTKDKYRKKRVSWIKKPSQAEFDNDGEHMPKSYDAGAH